MAKFQVSTTDELKTNVDNTLEAIRTGNKLATTKEAFEYFYNDYVRLKNEESERKERTTAILSQPDTRKKNFTGSSKERATLFINALLEHNEKCDELDRIYISATLIEREAGINRNGVKEAINELAGKISKQHEKYKLSADVNRRFINQNPFPRDENGKLIFIVNIMKEAGIYDVFKPRESGDE